jgi:hypothetical protein
MKYIITESQLEIIKDSILKIPFSAFNNDWNLLQKFLNKRGNPPYILKGKVDLRNNEEITTLGSLISVEGNLNLMYSSIQSLGNLISVDGDLDLYATTIQSLGNLKSVIGDLVLIHTPISRKYSEQEIRNIVEVGVGVYL